MDVQFEEKENEWAHAKVKLTAKMIHRAQKKKK